MHCTCSNSSFINVRNNIAECLFEKSRVITTCDLGSKQCRALLVGNDVKNVQGLVCAENDVSQEHCMVVAGKLEEYAGACIYDRVEVKSELFNS